MKKNYILFYLLLLNTICFAQKVGDHILDFKEVPFSDLKGEEYLNRMTIQPEDIITPKPVDGTFYDKFTFKFGKNTFWVPAKYNKTKGGYGFKLTKIGIPHYAENDQPFSDKPLLESNYIEKGAILYHSNGQVWKTVETVPNTTKSLETVYHPDGTLKRLYCREYLYSHESKSKLEGKLKQLDWCDSKNLIPYFHTQENGDTYLGYNLAGTITTNEGYSITGYIITLHPDYGSGGVFYLENLNDEKNYWVTLLNGTITSMQSALASEKPDIHQLQYAVNAQHEQWEIDGMSKNYLNKIPVSNLKSIENHNVYLRQENLSVVTKKIETHNGYGISMKCLDDAFYGDAMELKVGLFKNGVLDGMGYQNKIKYKYSTSHLGSGKKPSSSLRKLYAKWDYQVGAFEQGNFKKGRTITPKNYYRFTTDVWSEMAYEGFEYQDPDTYNKLIDQSIKLATINTQDYFYLPKINRQVTVKSFDAAAGTVTLNTDVKDVFCTIDLRKEPLYAHQKLTTNYKEQCAKTIQKPVYREEKVYLYSTAGTVKTSSYTVTGVYYDKKVTTITTTAGTPVYGSRYVKDHYESEVCYKCNGTGVVDATKIKNVYVKVVL